MKKLSHKRDKATILFLSIVRGIYDLYSQFTNNCALSTVAMTDNLWQPRPFYSVGVEISQFMCKFAEDRCYGNESSR